VTGGQPLTPDDPTENVLSLVGEAMKRQDDMRNLVAAHASEMAELRARYDGQLRAAETARIDAIRAVDVGAVAAAAQVSATQATTLAAQVATSAETLRTQVAAAATAATVALAAALEPIQKDIADLRRAQYEAQGQKTQVVEARSGISSSTQLIGAVVGIIVLALAIYAALHK
jgi:hypothetical protein